MNLTPQLTKLLKQLRLSGVVDTLEVRNRQAVDQQMSYLEFLTQLAHDEVERREHKKLTHRIRRASFASEKTLEGFNFDACPGLNRHWVLDLATCGYIDEAANVLIVGPSGVGKSHIAQALGHTACRRGYDVLFATTSRLLHHINAGRADGSYDRRLAQAIRVDLLILDDFGLKPLRSPADEDLHEIVAERYERRSTIITSNRDFSEWGAAFTNPLLAAASVDRLRHGAHCLTINADSYRSPRSAPENGGAQNGKTKSKREA